MTMRDDKSYVGVSLHGVTGIRPEIMHFKGFSVLYLYFESPTHGTLKVTAFYGENYNSPEQTPMDLLNQLGPAIENASAIAP